MSGHSKWATTKHKKAIIDSRRAKNFAKLIKAIEVASRNGGPDMDGNPTLFDAVAKAKKNAQSSVVPVLNQVAPIGKPLCMRAMDHQELQS
jgi:transcriptional/translational regulatory protein YebC/TACO1